MGILFSIEWLEAKIILWKHTTQWKYIHFKWWVWEMFIAISLFFFVCENIEIFFWLEFYLLHKAQRGERWERRGRKRESTLHFISARFIDSSLIIIVVCVPKCTFIGFNEIQTALRRRRRKEEEKVLSGASSDNRLWKITQSISIIMIIVIR